MRYNDNLSLFIIPYILGVNMIIGGILFVPQKKQCDLSSSYHVHLYTRNIKDVTIKKWLHNEEDTFNYIKNDELLPVTSFDLELYDKLDDYYLFDGRVNLDFINYQIRKNRDYMEFYYYYEEFYYVEDDEGNVKEESITYEGWSTNPRHEGVTGKVRVYHTRYYAYNIIYSNGELKLDKSNYVDDIREIINEYPYMSESTNIKVSEDFRFSRAELPYLNVEEITPFYTPTVENNTSILNNQPKKMTLKP